MLMTIWLCYMTETVILGVIGSDAHVVGITILERALDTAGFEVINLGAQTSRSEFVDAAASHDADAVLVSSMYGHAERDCASLHDRLSDAGLTLLTYVGGNLAVGQDDFEATRERFEAMGFDRVFDAETRPHQAIAALREDLNITVTEPRERATTDA